MSINLEALNFVDAIDFSFQKWQKFIEIKFSTSEYVKMGDFALLEFPELISRKI